LTAEGIADSTVVHCYSDLNPITEFGYATLTPMNIEKGLHSQKN